MKKTALKKILPKRTDVLFDHWSVIHTLSGIALGWFFAPAAALLLMILWEPLERLVFSPLFAKIGINFGYETIKNSLSDLIYDSIGILIGAYLLTWIVAPPVHFF
jgi:CBS domain containing-hemolysin-like protein